MIGDGDMAEREGAVTDAAVRRAFLLLRDPLASRPRAVGGVVLLAWLPWFAGEEFGRGVFWGLAGGVVLLLAWLLFFMRPKLLRTAEGERGTLEPSLRTDLRRREASRPLLLVTIVVMALAVGAGLVRRFARGGSPDPFELRMTAQFLLLGFLFAWDALVLIPGVRRLLGPDA